MKTMNFFKMALPAVVIMLGSMNVTGQGNLLENPGFEEEDNDLSGIENFSPWVAMTGAELLEDYSPSPNNVIANRITPSDAFWGNNPTCIPVHGGNYAGRLQASSSAGLYQLVEVTPGKTYKFKVYALHFRTNAANQTIRAEKVRIKSGDGTELLASADIGVEENTWMEATGSVTIPEEMTQIRFQVSHYDVTPIPNRAPATLIDDCEFYAEGESGLIGVSADNEKIVEIHYFNLLGGEISQPVENNIYIVKKVFESKKSEVSKILF